jgi:hypothetical protein
VLDSSSAIFEKSDFCESDMVDLASEMEAKTICRLEHLLLSKG